MSKKFVPESEQSCTGSLGLQSYCIAILCALWKTGHFMFLLFISLLAIDNQGILYCSLEY